MGFPLFQLINGNHIRLKYWYVLINFFEFYNIKKNQCSHTFSMKTFPLPLIKSSKFNLLKVLGVCNVGVQSIILSKYPQKICNNLWC